MSDTNEMDVEAEKLEKLFLSLAECEKDMEKAETEAEIYRIRHTKKIFEQRREILKSVPEFWYIVFAQNDDFSDYVRPEDFQYLEFITDIYVDYEVANSSETDTSKVDPRNFSITISFESPNNEIRTQTVTKSFRASVDAESGEDQLVSDPVSIEWPEEMKDITPHLIENKTTQEGKKNYRLGMKSFFSWFKWTGTKPGKEFRSGDELARLIAEELYPSAVKYYTDAVSGVHDDDESESEELDISDDDEGSDDGSEDGSEGDNDKKRKLENGEEPPAKK